MGSEKYLIWPSRTIESGQTTKDIFEIKNGTAEIRWVGSDANSQRHLYWSQRSCQEVLLEETKAIITEILRTCSHTLLVLLLYVIY